MLKKIKERADERKPKDKVTYKKIQEYIEKTYGFKVHTAYIAEVKSDLGLPCATPLTQWKNSNAQEPIQRRMVEAIKETLKHFEIV